MNSMDFLFIKSISLHITHLGLVILLQGILVKGKKMGKPARRGVFGYKNQLTPTNKETQKDLAKQ